MKEVTPPSLPLPAPHAMRKGRAVRRFTPRQRRRLIVALLAVTAVALCVVFR